MVQYRALVIALILLLSTTVPEVHSRSISEAARRDWLVVPDTVAAYFHKVVEKISPRISQFLTDIAETRPVSETRNYIMRELTKFYIAIDQLLERIKNMFNTKLLGY